MPRRVVARIVVVVLAAATLAIPQVMRASDGAPAPRERPDVTSKTPPAAACRLSTETLPECRADRLRLDDEGPFNKVEPGDGGGGGDGKTCYPIPSDKWCETCRLCYVCVTLFGVEFCDPPTRECYRNGTTPC